MTKQAFSLLSLMPPRATSSARAGTAPGPLPRRGASMLLATAGVLWSGAAAQAAEPDFNHDGYADLVISAHAEDVGGAANAGLVHVIYGSSQGASATGAAGTGRPDQTFSIASLGVAGVAPAAEDSFGKAVAWGDFNADGWTDLAIGIRGREVDGSTSAGAVAIIYGLPGQGFIAAGLKPGGTDGNAKAQLITQSSIGVAGTPEAGDAFGAALASGDFNGDGIDDLAVGAPGEDYPTGGVNIIYGSATPQGLGYGKAGTIRRCLAPAGSSCGSNTIFLAGATLAAADFDGDGHDDLAIGSDWYSRGLVTLIYGTSSGFEARDLYMLRQGYDDLQGEARDEDGFGKALAAGDFDNDGFADLAIGAPQDRVPVLSGYDVPQGSVSVVYGTNDGLSTFGSQLFFPSFLGNAGNELLWFGQALATGNLDGQHGDDLVIGAPSESGAGYSGTGAAYILYSMSSGLSILSRRYWTQEKSVGFAFSSPICDEFHGDGDHFGKVVRTGDYNNDGRADLAVSAPGKSLSDGVGHEGMVFALTSGSAFLNGDPRSFSSARSFRQGSDGVNNAPHANDGFGQ
ncbi:hypothetical protein WME99_00775 [Sorangium sp. So ce136]|uniref:hypothetical protein n=1 Tax=Sorangium sp. So ce136 TaxID=3133284 RepID=UPI003F109CDF